MSDDATVPVSTPRPPVRPRGGRLLAGGAIAVLLTVNAAVGAALWKTTRQPPAGSSGLIMRADEPRETREPPLEPSLPLDLSHGVLLRADPGRCGAGTAALRRSEDSGRTWHLGHTPVSTILRVKVVDQHWAWLVGTDQTCRPRFYVTADQGRSWHERDTMLGLWYRLPARPGQLHAPTGPTRSPCAPASRTLDVTGLTQVLATVVCDDGSAYRTSNGARSWRRLAVRGDARAVDFPTATTGFAAVDGVCAGLRVDATTDAGRSWQAGGCVPVGTGQSVSLSFASAQQGVLTTGDSVFRTDDGGLHWQRGRFVSFR
jgi:photosystem II stability/assembly factor-like uncharacterized protein